MVSARAELEEEILQLSRQINLMSSAEKENQRGISVVIMAKKATIIELRLTYCMWSSTPKVDFLPNSSLVVQNATCLVVYELHATTEAGLPASSVSLYYRAWITQCTREDWTDIKLTLSTLRTYDTCSIRPFYSRRKFDSLDQGPVSEHADRTHTAMSGAPHHM